MTPISTYNQDFNNEQLLGNYLDEIYTTLFIAPECTIERINSIDLQYLGIDLLLTKNNKTYNIDEKAQLNYLNKTLPTFAFELSYLKNDSWRQGWLLDSQKKTTNYFLITEIYCTDTKDLKKGIHQLKITNINRKKLIEHLASKGLTSEALMNYEKSIRSTKTPKTQLKELNTYAEGNIHFTEFLNEKPINLVLKLDNLVKQGVAQVLYNPKKG